MPSGCHWLRSAPFLDLNFSLVLCAEERLKFIRLLQKFAEQRGFRVTILSGDAHVGGVGQLYSHPKYKDLR